jgi:AbiV family abortive infection protein
LDITEETELQEIIAACQSHAEDLLNAAKTVLKDERLPNIAYHLATLALEEIGKSELVGMSRIAKIERGDSLPWAEKQTEDHVKKLFWALWGPSFGKEKLTGKQIQSYTGLAQNIHERRINGLYVDSSSKESLHPKDSIKTSEAENLINLTYARIQISKSHKFEKISHEKEDVLSWFLEATGDKEKRKLILGPKSLKKLVEIGNVSDWVKWLKDEFDKAEEEARAQMERELKRTNPAKNQSMDEKWRIKIRLFSNSHSIRPKVLHKWNELPTWIKLLPIDKKKDQLIVQLILLKQIPVQGLWSAGWGVAKTFAVALNIASMGFFWWYVPKDTSRFYESIKDLESNMDVRVERSPKLELDWGRKRALSDHELGEAALCFGMLSRIDHKEKNKILGHYISGMNFWSKNDIHLQLEANSYEGFYKCLKNAMRFYGDWDGEILFLDNFVEQLSKLGISEKEKQKLIRIGSQFEVFPPKAKGITLSEVGMIKIACDAYLIKKFRELAKQETTNSEV